ncbi:MAG: hypothetical protein DRG59_02070 [Deltaproteobacteria bacterium]|nr:MAG: hypothetical protein DRG83_02795 [Deltaproteobacteria bacterium]RLB09540.1 MAG: hypothetical protein DRG59_02070 [Deltaproteobacteria bacterium]
MKKQKAILMEKVQLKNGLTLEFWDESKHLVGDRWYVGVRAMVAIAIPDETPDGFVEDHLQVLRNKLGDKVYFQLLEERNFIPEEEVEELKKRLRDVFLKNSLTYLSHPDFSRRFLLVKSEEAYKKKLMGPEYLEKFLEDLKGPPSNQGRA